MEAHSPTKIVEILNKKHMKRKVICHTKKKEGRSTLLESLVHLTSRCTNFGRVNGTNEKEMFSGSTIIGLGKRNQSGDSDLQS